MRYRLDYLLLILDGQVDHVTCYWESKLYVTEKELAYFTNWIIDINHIEKMYVLSLRYKPLHIIKTISFILTNQRSSRTANHNRPI